MILKQLNVGPLMTNCFILGCPRTREAVVIDPGGDSRDILLALADESLTLKYIINTHGHFDHVGANKELKKATNAAIIIHADDAPMLTMLKSSAAAFGLYSDESPPPDRLVDDGDVITFGELSLKVLHTPGHSPGGISLAIDDMVFVGDTLFAGSIGRTDFPGGNFDTLLASIQTKLFPLGDHVTVYSGHTPETTIGQEKRFNPFVGER